MSGTSTFNPFEIITTVSDYVSMRYFNIRDDVSVCGISHLKPTADTDDISCECSLFYNDFTR